MENTSVQAVLLGLLESASSAQNAWIGELSAAERAAAGTPEQWSAKDMLAHVVFWQQVTIDRLAAAQRGEEPPMFGDFQPVNERVFEERRELPWEQVLADAERAYATLTEHVRAMDAQVLTDPQRFAWTKGQALISGILANGFWHPIEHAAHYYVAHGAPEQASALLDRTIVQEQALGALPRERGAALYNTACLYATTGQPDKALPLLPEALHLSPDLVAWSKQDSDLDTLRAMPAFQALYEA
jgi:hypothetical protein